MEKSEMTPVILAAMGRDADGKEMKLAVRAAAEAATDFSWLSRGDVVFIKPAHNSGKPYPATTHPVAVGAMIELLRQKGARRVIVGDMAGIEHVKLTSQGLSRSTRRLMETSGMAGAVGAAGGELHFFEEAGWQAFHEERPAIGAHWQGGLMMPDILREVDHIILMPRCSRHVLLGATLGLKSAVGYWRTDTRLEYHREASTIQEKTAEGNTVDSLLKKQRLVISAADKILATFGPDDGIIIQTETGLVMASPSVVAHDMVSLAWLLENRGRLAASEQDAFRDGNRLFTRLANHYVVKKLGGLGSSIASERLTKDPLNTIWDDRVLNRAYEVLGGRPQVVLEVVGVDLPEELHRRLQEMITPAT
jgi:uncharacterized protein (DUF362 family)